MSTGLPPSLGGKGQSYHKRRPWKPACFLCGRPQWLTTLDKIEDHHSEAQQGLCRGSGYPVQRSKGGE